MVQHKLLHASRGASRQKAQRVVEGADMPESPSRIETKRIIGSLKDQASGLWGPQRATELRLAIESTAANIAILRKDLPSLAEEPGFYLQ